MKDDSSYSQSRTSSWQFLASCQLIVSVKNDKVFMLQCSSHNKPLSLQYKAVNMSTLQSTA